MSLKLGAKINVIFLAVILSLSVIIGFVVYHEISIGVKEFAVEKAKGDLRLANRYLDNEYPGDWEIRDKQLYKGTKLINGNFGIVDIIGKDTDDTVTIFQGNTRIATNVIKDGKRAVGTQVSPEVEEIVLKKGKYYYGEADVAGHTYQTAYMPIKNRNNEIIGIFYVGAPDQIINKILSSFFVKFIVVVGIMIVISGVCIYWFTFRMKKRLSTITEALQLAGDGDFTTEIKDRSRDEFGVLASSYNQMSEKLKRMLHNVMATSEAVAASSEQLTASAQETSRAAGLISESIQQVAGGAEDSTSSVQESAISLQEATKAVQSIAENASVISGVSSQATEKAKEGEASVDKTVEQIKEIKRSVVTSGEVIKLLDKRSAEIGEITKVISSIAEQTNLLALNAAIEAARAGDHGRGFAVVADEVRKLAEESHKSSSQITSLISVIQKDMKQSNLSIEQVSSAVDVGLEIVQETEGNFKEISYFMKKLSTQIVEMAETAEEISASIQEVSSNIAGIASISNQTTEYSHSVAASAEQQLASMEEIATASNSLSNQADELQKLIGKFII